VRGTAMVNILHPHQFRDWEICDALRFRLIDGCHPHVNEDYEQSGMPYIVMYLSNSIAERTQTYAMADIARLCGVFLTGAPKLRKKLATQVA